MVTLAHPVAGFIATTAVVVYHWFYHRDIVQRIEMSVLLNPKMLAKNQRYAAPTYRKAKSGEQAKSREGQTKVEGDGTSQTGGREERGASKTEVKIKSPYVWSYSEW